VTPAQFKEAASEALRAEIAAGLNWALAETRAVTGAGAEAAMSGAA